MAREGSSENPWVDVYGMMLVLGFVMTLGACLLLNDELSSNWGFKFGGEKPADQKWHLTQFREFDPTKKDTESLPYVNVRQKDLEEWKLINKGATFPVTDFEWPGGKDKFKVDEFPVDPSIRNNWESVQPNASDDEKEKKRKEDKLKEFGKLLAAAPVEAPKEPPAPAPADPAKPDAEKEKKPDAEKPPVVDPTKEKAQ